MSDYIHYRGTYPYTRDDGTTICKYYFIRHDKSKTIDDYEIRLEGSTRWVTREEIDTLKMLTELRK